LITCRGQSSIAVIGTAAFVAAGGTGAADRRFTLLTRPVEFGGADPADAKLGEQFVFTDQLFDEAGREVGISGGACTVVSREPRMAACAGGFRLPNGDLAVAALVDLADLAAGETYRLAVVGGTNAYRHARGQMTVRPPATEEEPFVVDVDLR
jgi:hypothetical protein